jgi:phosphoribosylamine--glycine ligase
MHKIYQGTTKDLIQLDDRTYFIFKDTYSIFDWGIMPNNLEDKGYHLCQLSADIFNFLAKNNIKHNMIDYFNNQMQIEYFHKKEFIDLEVIFRFGVPKGSSLIQRGFEEGKIFENVKVEFTTKRERIDRLLDENEALQISGLSKDEFKSFKQHIEKCANSLNDYFKRSGIFLWDGKFEFAFKNGEFILCDSIGIDELRLSYKNIYFSKECLRNYYKNTSFYRELIQYKEKNFDLDPTKIIHKPKKLPHNIEAHYKDMYKGCYKALVKKDIRLFEKWCQREELFSSSNKVLIIGDGGREHCLAKRMSASPLVSDVILQTKRDNLFTEYKTINLNEDELLNYCQKEKVNLVVIGPEKPLCEGLADKLRNKGIATLGAGQEASKLEGSKIYSKNFMHKYNIPSAKSYSFNNYKEALKFLLSTKLSEVVIKVDGLASGKGVSVCKNLQIAKNELKRLESDYPNSSYLIEEVLQGKELSIFYLIDNNEIKFIGDACDHKRLLENDMGPNTGGMGTYSPCDWLSKNEIYAIQLDLKEKLSVALQKESYTYNGILFVGLMVQADQYNVLEFNVRLGDPETQVLLPRLDADLFVLFNQCAHNLLDSREMSLKDESYVHIVCASESYPYQEAKSVEIDCESLNSKDIDRDQFEFIMAGMKKDQNKFYTSGGRVCGLTAKGESKKLARLSAYNALEKIKFTGMKYRNDIAK